MTDFNPRYHKAQVKWTSLDLSLVDEDWSEFSDTYKTSVIASQHRIIQVNAFHQTHLTPARLHRMGLLPSAACFRGCGQEADFSHCFWSCPVVPALLGGSGCFHLIGARAPKHNPPQGLPILHLSSHAKRLLHILYFYVRKAILLSWKGAQTSLKSLWLKRINDAIPLYKLTLNLLNSGDRTKPSTKFGVDGWLVR